MDSTFQSTPPGSSDASGLMDAKQATVDWQAVLARQHLGTLGLAAVAVTAVGFVHWAGAPAQRPFFLYDASISYISSGNSVSSAAAVLVPFVALFASLAAFELAIIRGHSGGLTDAAALMLHFAADAFCAFAIAVLVTEVTKNAAGRLRPDFFQECGPTAPLSGPATLGLVPGIECTLPAIDGRKSFPSGHSSSCSVTMCYSVVYCMWSGYFRGGEAGFMGDRITGRRAGHRLWQELGHIVYLLWILLQLGFIWAVGTSRFLDNKHHVSDAVAGWLLGGVVAVVFSVRAICMHKLVVLPAQGTEGGPSYEVFSRGPS